MCHSLFCLLNAISMFRWKTSEPAEKSPDEKDAAILLLCVFFSTIILLCQDLFLKVVEKRKRHIMWKMGIFPGAYACICFCAITPNPKAETLIVRQGLFSKTCGSI